MKPFAWLGLAIVSGGTVLMYFSERVAVFSMDRMAGVQPGWFGHVHWSLLVGMLLALLAASSPSLRQPNSATPDDRQKFRADRVPAATRYAYNLPTVRASNGTALRRDELADDNQRCRIRKPFWCLYHRSPAVVASKRQVELLDPLRLARRKREPRRADLVILVPPLLELGQDVCSRHPIVHLIMRRTSFPPSCLGHPRERRQGGGVSDRVRGEQTARRSRLPNAERFAEPNFRWSPMRTVTAER